ncbi:hypothetical protein VC83_01308 [Pseudogymnoascus destructans]|uniref:F-box domain-containing protein n=2 Tax=Pseudogymnoascus destructans TaxID=655981 RepID=L8G2H9_PSED2|nr:uncharacterized protein VC83_01308 [Pseudogymnoascus destructans]ELR06161.1 hypothetical protein GMDG_07816 [Pseudogymnoascus destructans 20631-21]OAF62318.2 hypothetical protein VC83_01308 [Pseudogymnoascus destructans]
MEILIAIFKEVDDIDQLALAVSCKHLLQVFTLVSLKTSIWLKDILVRLLSPTTNARKICSVCTLYRPTGKSVSVAHNTVCIVVAFFVAEVHSAVPAFMRNIPFWNVAEVGNKPCSYHSYHSTCQKPIKY